MEELQQAVALSTRGSEYKRGLLEAQRITLNAPEVEPEETLVPIAKVQFDDDKLREIVDEAVSRISIQYNWRDAKKKLPPEGRHILVTLDHGVDDLEVTKIDYGVCRYMAEHEHVEECAKLLRDVVAWMELPGPWKGDSK